MRIAFLSHQWPGIRMGGIGSAVRQTAIALSKAGHEVHVFTFAVPDSVRAAVPESIRFHEADDLARRVERGQIPAPLGAALQAGGDGAYRLSLGWLLCDRLLHIHRERPFDVVEAPDVEAMSLPLVFNRQFDAPVVTHLHCCTSIARAVNESGDPDPLLPALELAAIHLADAVCAPTQAVVNATQKFVPVPQDVSIIPHPFPCPTEPFRSPPGDGSIVFVGRIERLKGVQTIAEALNQFLPGHPGATFRFVGPDTSTAAGGTSMRHWIEANLLPSVRGRVQFTGELEPAQIAKEWQAARFGVMPSLCENFSMACCEAMSFGRTLIVGNGTGSVELVGPAGIAVDPSDAAGLCRAMESLWVDSDQTDRLSRAAYDRILTLCNPVTVAETRVAFYQSAIDRFRSRGRSDLTGRLRTLPPPLAAALLPALTGIVGDLSGAAHCSTHTPGLRLLNVMDQIGQPARVLLYGAGKHTARLLSERHVWESRGHRVVGIIDDHARFAQTPVYLDLPVQSLEQARARILAGNLVPPVVLSTDTYQDQFWKQSEPLRAAGVPVFRLYS
ncbi:MAG TPA: glycosyltransferase family 4 protein [Tepidisphaeraceae bacterium]|nr:glycosyltransferase family 4 protein [Tepidisphaeraceae bacterium]